MDEEVCLEPVKLERIVYIKNPDSVNDMKCKHCGNILVNPVYCTKCYENHCSGCAKELNNICSCGSDNTFEDCHPLLKKLLGDIIISCINKDNGCDKNVEYKNIYDHEKLCEYRKILCPNNCGIEIRYIDSNSHGDSCKNKMVTCEFCNSDYKKEFELEHLKTCNTKRISCDCGKEFNAKQYKKHKEECNYLDTYCKVCNITIESDSKSEHNNMNCIQKKYDDFNDYIDNEFKNLKKQSDFLQLKLYEQCSVLNNCCNNCKKGICHGSAKVCIICKNIYCTNCLRNKLFKCEKCSYYFDNNCGKNNICNICSN